MIPKTVRTFLDDLTGRSSDTIDNYTSFANVFWTYVDKPIDEITVKDIMAFLKWGLEKKKWKLTTMKQYAKLAQRFMGEFKDEDFMKELKKQIRMLPKTRMYEGLYEGIYIPPDEVEYDKNGKVARIIHSTIDDFIDAAPNEEYAVCYTMILKWGARLSEALNQRLSDVNAKLARVIIRGKGAGFEAKARPVWVDRDSLKRVLAFAGCNHDEISGSKTIRRKGRILSLSPRAVELAWKKTAKKVKLAHCKKLTPHDGRHSYSIDFLIKRKSEGMAALVLLKNQLGHSNINTTMIYLDIAGTEAREVFDAGVKNESP